MLALANVRFRKVLLVLHRYIEPNIVNVKEGARYIRNSHGRCMQSPPILESPKKASHHRQRIQSIPSNKSAARPFQSSRSERQKSVSFQVRMMINIPSLVRCGARRTCINSIKIEHRNTIIRTIDDVKLIRVGRRGEVCFGSQILQRLIKFLDFDINNFI